MAGSTQVITLTIVDDSAAATGADDPEPQRFSVGNAEQVSIAGSDLSLLGVELGMGENYNLLIPRGTIADAAGNTVETQLMFTTAITDSSNPTFMSSTPANDSFVAEIPAVVSLVFSENITIDASTIQTAITISGGEAGGSQSIGAVTVNAENAAQLDIAVSGLANNTRYTITVQSSAITDAAGNALQDNVVLRFTPDSTAPVFEADMSTPANNAIVNTAPTATISLVFSEEIRIVDSSMFSIAGSGTANSEVIDSSQVEESTLELEVSGLANEMYTITIPRASVSDRAGNNPANDIIQIFSIDTERPVLVESVSVADNISTNTAPVSLHFEFSENIRIANASSITLTGGAGSVASSATGTRLELMVSGVVHGMYSITIGNNAITDSAGNTLADPIIRNFAFDSMPPDFASALPNSSSGQITISFNEDIRLIPGSGESITLYEGATSVDTFALGDSSRVAVSGRTITLSRVTLTEQMTYTIAIPAAIVRDSAGNSNTEITRESNRISLTITDTTAPRYENDSIVHDRVENTITLRFNENIAAGTGSIVLSGEGADQNFDVTTASVTFTNDMLEIMVLRFVDSIAYTLSIPAGAVADTEGNTNESEIPISFTTLDTTAPMLVNNPVAVNDSFNEITVEFNENITVLNAVNITLTNGSGTIVSATVSSMDTNLVLSATGVRFPNDTYTIAIPAMSIEDTNNNANTEAITIPPYTLDDTAPRAPVRDFAVSTTGTLTLTIEFDSQITLVSSNASDLANNISITNGPSGHSTSITAMDIGVNAAGTGLEIPLSNVIETSGTNYRIAIAQGTVQNSVPNGNSPFSVTLRVDGTGPEVLSTDPASSGETLTSIPGTLTITFNEAIQLLASASLRMTGPSVATLGTPSFSASNLVIPVSGIASGGMYTLTIAAGSVADTLGNENISITRIFAIDETGPMLLSTDPSNSETLNSLPTVFTFRFNENIREWMTSSIRLEVPSTGGAASIGTVEVDSANPTDLRVPVSVLRGGGVYTITLPPRAVLNALGNGNTAITETFTIDSTAPTVNSTLPSDSSEMSDLPSTITLRFNENIELLSTVGIGITGPSTGSIGTVEVDSTNPTDLLIPVSGLRGGGVYTLTVPENAVESTRIGNRNEVITRSFTVESTPPDLALANLSKTVINAERTEITLAFTEDIRIVNPGTIRTTITLTNTTRSASASISNVALGSANELVLTVGTMLSPLALGDYSIAIPSGEIEDANNNPNASISATINAGPLFAFTDSLADQNEVLNADRTQIRLEFTESISIVESIASGISLIGDSAGAQTISNSAVDSGDNTTLVLTVAAPLPEDMYTLTIPAGAVQDSALEGNYELSLEIPVDASPPSIINTAPSVNSIADQVLNIEFNEAIRLASMEVSDLARDIVISGGADGNTSAITHADIEVVDINGNANSALAIPLTNLQETNGSNYTISIAANAIEDMFGNAHAGESIRLTIDRSPPALTGDAPVLNSDRTEVRIGFTENIRIVDSASIATAVRISNIVTLALADIDMVSVNGSDLVITLASPLAQGSYTVSIPESAITDRAQNAPVGSPPGSDLSILIDGTIDGAPAFRAGDPVQIANGRTQVTLLFTENIRFVNESTNAANITLTGTTSGQITISTFAISAANLVLTVPELANDTYTAAISAEAIQDEANNRNPAAISTQFTVDTTLPALLSNTALINPARTEITLEFAEDIRFHSSSQFAQDNISISNTRLINTDPNREIPISNADIRNNASGNPRNLVLTVPALPLSDYDIVIPTNIVEDTSDNANASITITIDGPPLLTSREPAISGTTIRLTFTETITIANQNNIELTNSAGVVVDTTSAVDSNTDLVVTVSALPDGAYTLSISAGAVQDGATPPNANPNIANIPFTVDTVLPTLSANPFFTNADRSSIDISFNENVQINGTDTLSLVIERVTRRGTVLGTQNATGSIQNGNILRVSGYNASWLNQDGMYRIILSQGAFIDAGGNVNNELTVNFTLDSTIPALTASSIRLNSLADQTITLGFNRAVRLAATANASTDIVLTGGAAANATAITYSGVEVNAAGTGLEIPLTALQETNGNNYTITISPNTIENQASPNTSHAQPLIFTIIVDRTGPALASPTPTLNAARTEITLAFNESISIADSNITSDSTLTNTSGTVSITSAVVQGSSTLVLTVPELQTGVYTLIIPEGDLQDLTLNTNSAVQAMFTVDTVTGSPSLTSTTALYDGMRTITLPFNENIRIENPGTVRNSIELRNSGTNATIDISNVAVSGNTNLQLSINNPLSTGSYSVSIPSNEVSDFANNANESALTASFMVDGTLAGPPALVNTNPVVVNTNGTLISLAFTEDIRIVSQGTVAGDIELRNSNNTRIDINSVVASGTNGLELNLSNANALATDSYTIRIPQDSVQDRANNGNQLLNSSFGFDRVPGNPALVDSPLSLNSARDEITLVFNENIAVVNPGSITSDINLVNSDTSAEIGISNAVVMGNTTLVITLDSALGTGNYTLSIPASAVEDGLNNRNAEDSESFMVDATAPDLVTANSLSFNTAISEIALEFTEAISITNPGTFVGVFDLEDSASPPNSLTITGATIRDNTTLVLSVSALPDNSYTLEIAESAVQDGAGNGNAAETVQILVDTVRPAASTPTRNAERTEITVAFNEAIRIANEAAITLNRVITGGAREPVTITSIERRNSNTDLVLVVSALPSGSYELSILENAIVDSANNGNSPISNSFSVDVTPPDLVTANSLSFNTAISEIVLEFTEAVSITNPGTFVGVFDLEDSASPPNSLTITGATIRDNTTLVLSVSALPNNSYTLEIAESAVQDGAGNGNEAETVQILVDTVRPAASTPTRNAERTEITVAFNESIRIANEAAITLNRVITGGAREPVTITSIERRNSNTNLVLVVNALTTGSYELSILENAIVDSANNGNSPISNSFSIDVTGPELSATAPLVNNARTQITVSFTENISLASDAATVAAGIQLSNSGGSITVTNVIVRNNSDLELIISPANTPLEEDSYTLVIPTNSVQDESANANPMQMITFRVDLSPPELASLPLVHCRDITLSNQCSTQFSGRTDITLVFNENITVVDGVDLLSAITIFDASMNPVSMTSAVPSGGTNIVLNPTAPLTSTTVEYTLSINSNTVQDSAGNPNAPIMLTLDTTPPFATRYSLNNDRTQLTAHLSEDVSFIARSDLRAAFFRLELAGTRISINSIGISPLSNSQVIVELDNPLSEGMYTAYSTGDYYRDSAGNRGRVGVRNRIDFTVDTASSPPAFATSGAVARLSDSRRSFALIFDRNISIENTSTIATDIRLENSSSTRIDISSVALSTTNSNELIISTESALNEIYSIRIPANSIRNDSGVLNPSELMASALDFRPLLPTTTNASINEDGTEISFEFSTPISLATSTGINLIRDPSTTATPIPTTASLSGQTLVLSVSALEEGDYSLSIPAGFVRNNFVGNTEISDTFTINLLTITPFTILLNPSRTEIRFEAEEEVNIAGANTGRMSLVQRMGEMETPIPFTLRGGNNIFIEVGTALSNGEYTITLERSALRSTAMNIPNDRVSVNFTVNNTSQLSIESTSISSDRGTIGLVFNKNISILDMATLAANIRLEDISSTRINVSSLGISTMNAQELVITPESALAQEVYTLRIPEESIQGTADVFANEAIESTIDLRDLLPSTADASINEDGTEISFEFNKPISLATSTGISLTRTASGTSTTIATTASTRNRSLVLSVSALEEGVYSLTIPSGVVQDSFNFQNAELSDTFTIDLITISPQTPLLNASRTEIRFIPEVGVNIAEANNNIGRMSLVQRMGDTETSIPLASIGGGSTIFIFLRSALGHGEYTITLERGAFRSTAMNVPNDRVSIDFTVDLQAPTVTGNPSFSTSGSETTVTLEFNETIAIANEATIETDIVFNRVNADSSTTPITINNAEAMANQLILSFNPALSPANYSISIPARAIRDAANNFTPTAISASLDTLGPTIESVVYSDNTTLTFTFTEIIELGANPTITISYMHVLDGPASTSFTLTGGPSRVFTITNTGTGISNTLLPALGTNFTYELSEANAPSFGSDSAGNAMQAFSGNVH